MKHLILFLLMVFPATIFAQTSGIVVDKKSGKAIAYANIWVKDQNIGTTSDEKGQFTFKENLIKKTLFVSAIGYESLQKNVDQGNLTIELNPKTYLIEEITVHPRKRNETIIDEYKKSSINHYLFTSSQPWIAAKFFKYSPVYESTPFIKSINILTKSEINNAIFNLRLMSVSVNGEPSNDILKENLIIKTMKGKGKLFVDLSKFQIAFPKKGFFVSVESLTLESNRSEYTYTMKGSNKKIHDFQHNPRFGLVLSDKNTSFWTFRNGKWNDVILNKIKEKSQELAIELTLTD